MDDLVSQLHRIFLGDKSLWFLLEVAFRTTIIFSYTLLLLRFMGKRGMGQLTPFEFAIIVALGSAVGDPMFYGDVPLVHTMLVIAIVVSLHRLLTIMTLKNDAIEQFIEGRTTMLVSQGCINYRQLDQEHLSREELFELLRPEGISHLGQVQQAFLEPSGKLSVIRWEPARAGLSILPGANSDQDYDQRLDAQKRCCPSCGTMEHSISIDTDCAGCLDQRWVHAVVGEPRN
ncbi:MAG: DUF421 domain-containing protein [Aureliella sp.]